MQLLCRNYLDDNHPCNPCRHCRQSHRNRWTEGFCWYTYDDSKFYIDHKDKNGILVRKALNAKDAETITGASLATILNSSDIEIPTSKAVLDALATKSQVQMITPDAAEILSTLKIHKISQEEYDKALADGTLEENAIYLTPDNDIDMSTYATIEQLQAVRELALKKAQVQIITWEVDD